MVDERADRTMQFGGLANARDLGGLHRVGGDLTPRGVLFRSENVDRLSPAGWDSVHAAGIRTIVDLRRPGERQRDRTARPAWVTVAAVDLDGSDEHEFWKDYWDNGLVWGRPCTTCRTCGRCPGVRRPRSARPGGVLFHCMGGRDRTGLIAMLLLAAVDVEPTEIVDDYLETVRRGDIRAATANCDNDEAEIDALCRRHGTSTDGAFADAVRGLDLARVLTDGGLGAEDKLALSTWRGTIHADPPGYR